VDYDIDDEGEEVSIIVPKSEKDRSDTEQYIIQTLSEQGMSDLLKYDILTISAKLALEALKNNDDKLFEASNMGALLERLMAITKNDAAELKKATPRKRLNEMIDSIIKDLNNMSEQFSIACSSVEKNQQELEDRRDDIIEQIRSKVLLKIVEIVAEYKVKVERDKAAVSEAELNDKIIDAIRVCIQQVCTEEAINSSGKIENLDIKLTGIGDMKMRQDHIPYEHVSVKTIIRPPKGLFEQIGHKFFNKEYYTTVSHKEIKFSDFDIGVNDSEIAQNIILKLNDIFNNTVSVYIDSIVSGYYKPIKELQKRSVDEISRAVERLNGLK
jgi:hypothetical protein